MGMINSLSEVLSTPKHPLGTIMQYPDDPKKKIIYVQIKSSDSSVKVGVGACSNGRAGIYDPTDGTMQCYAGITGINYKGMKMIIGLVSASVGKYCWALYEGAHSAVIKDGQAASAGDWMTIESHSHTIARRAAVESKGDRITCTALVQGIFISAATASQTTVGCVLYGAAA